MSRRVVIVICVHVLCVAAGFAWASETSFRCRTAQGDNYDSQEKTFFRYKTGDKCYQGQDWCIETHTGEIKLEHDHFVDDYVDWGDGIHYEQADAERYTQFYRSPEKTLQQPTTAFNCHAYALYERGDVWISETSYRPIEESDDFRQVDGTHEDPYMVGDLCNHCYTHTSRIVELDNPTGEEPWDAAKTVKAKWGAYGKYESDDDQGYGEPAGIHRNDWE